MKQKAMPMSASTIPTAMQYTTAAPETMISSSSSNQSSVDTKCVVSSSSVKKMVCGFSVWLIRVVLIDWSGSEGSNLLSFYNPINSYDKKFFFRPTAGFSPRGCLPHRCEEGLWLTLILIYYMKKTSR